MMTNMRYPVLALVALALSKIVGLIIWGPLQQPDSLAYLAYAQTILTDTSWWAEANMATQAVPETVFRTFGYPAVIAAANLITGSVSAALYLVVLLQIALSLLATVVAYRLGQALLKNTALATLVAAGHALSVTFTYDQHILTDSLFNSLSVIGFAVPVMGFLQKRVPSPLQLFGLGAMLAAACLVRGIGIYVVVFFLPAYAAWLFVSYAGMAKTVTRALAFVLPLVVVIGGVMAWNTWRTGYTFFTTGSQYVLIQPLVKMQARGVDVFDGDTAIDMLAKKYLKTYQYSEAVTITEALFTEYGVNAYHSAIMHSAIYFRTLATKPGAVLYHGVRNYEEGLIHQFFNVLDNGKVYLKFATGERPWPGMKKLWQRVKAEHGLLDMLLVLGLGILRFIAWSSFLALFIGVPIVVIRSLRRGWHLPSDVLAIFYCWGLYFAYSFGLCMIHMVDRFLPAVLSAGLVGALFCWQRLYRHFRPATAAN